MTKKTTTKQRSGHREIEWVDLETIKLAKKNPRDHDLGMLIAALEQRGLGELPLLDERTGRLVAGHGRVKALKAMKKDGKPRPVGVAGLGDTWAVPVITGWASKDDADAAAYLVGSNKAPELGGWDEAGLNELLVEVAKADAAALAGTGFDGDDLDRMLRDAGRNSSSNDDEQLAEPRKIYVKDGDLYRCGEHLVACGESFAGEAQDRLFAAARAEKADAVVTDPPYSIFGSSTGVASDVSDDRMVLPFFEKVLAQTKARTVLHGHLYLFCDWRSYPSIREAGRRVELAPKNCLIWFKGASGLGGMWMQCHEFIAFFTNAPIAISQWLPGASGARSVNKANVLQHSRPMGDEREHNAAKPVDLLAELVEASTDRGGLVWDPFCGSGSTLIACERLGRRCVTGDTEPKWVQVTIERWARKTGGKPEKVEASK